MIHWEGLGVKSHYGKHHLVPVFCKPHAGGILLPGFLYCWHGWCLRNCLFRTLLFLMGASWSKDALGDICAHVGRSWHWGMRLHAEIVAFNPLLINHVIWHWPSSRLQTWISVGKHSWLFCLTKREGERNRERQRKTEILSSIFLSFFQDRT